MENPFENLRKYQIILASQSPRRKELLTQLGLPFVAHKSEDVEENFPDSLQENEIVEFLAKKKADAFPIKADELVITADTIVWLNGKVFGKPTDKADAKKMLRTLSGKTHIVFTGVCISSKEKQRFFSAASEVTFSELSDYEIDYYVETFTPLDKAGSYGIQEWIGFVGVEKISGSFWNVMGLPIQKLYHELVKF